jgi:hypothetical protein
MSADTKVGSLGGGYLSWSKFGDEDAVMDGSDRIILEPDRLASLRYPFNISTVHCKSGYSSKHSRHTIRMIERFMRICLSLRSKRVPLTLDL